MLRSDSFGHADRAISVSSSFPRQFGVGANTVSDRVGKDRESGHGDRRCSKRWFARTRSTSLLRAERKRSCLADQRGDGRISLKFWRLRDPIRKRRRMNFERNITNGSHMPMKFCVGNSRLEDRPRADIHYLGQARFDRVAPSGGSYDRPSYEGGGSTTTYPFETVVLPAPRRLGDGVEIEFVDPPGTASTACSRRRRKERPGHDAPDRGSEGSDTWVGVISGQQDTPHPGSRAATLDNPPQPRFTDLSVFTDGPVIDNNPLASTFVSIIFGSPTTGSSPRLRCRRTTRNSQFAQDGDLSTATINILGRITSVSNKRAEFLKIRS